MRKAGNNVHNRKRVAMFHSTHLILMYLDRVSLSLFTHPTERKAIFEKHKKEREREGEIIEKSCAQCN